MSNDERLLSLLYDTMPPPKPYTDKVMQRPPLRRISWKDAKVLWGAKRGKPKTEVPYVRGGWAARFAAEYRKAARELRNK